MASERSFETLFGGDGDTNTSATPGVDSIGGKRPRKPRTTTPAVVISKSALVDILSLANMPIQLSNYSYYALSAKEIDALADAWHKVIKQNPSVAKYLVMGEKLGVWGNLLFVHAQIIGSRLEIYNAHQNASGRARPNGGPERKRQDDTGPTSTFIA